MLAGRLVRARVKKRVVGTCPLAWYYSWNRTARHVHGKYIGLVGLANTEDLRGKKEKNAGLLRLGLIAGHSNKA